MPFLYDLIHAGPGQQGAGDDWAGSGLTSAPQPQSGGWAGTGLGAPPMTPGAPAAADQPAGQSAFLQWLRKMAQQQGGGLGTPQMAQPGSPPTAQRPMPASTAGSHQGFLTGSSRGGFDLGDAMKVAALVGTMGAGAGAVGAMGGAGAMGGGTAAGGGAAMGGAGGGGGGFLSGLMGGGKGGGGGLGGLMGGGGGGDQQNAPPMPAYAPLPQPAPPLIPQYANQWDVSQSAYPWMFQG
jgi:hypothetical protein